MPVLVVQMGHAGRITGATGAPGEQAYTIEVGAACARLLDERGGWSVRLIVADPPAAQYRGDAFVAIHADGSTNPAVRGASIGYQNVAGEQFAAAWQHAYVALGFSGPWHPDNYTANLAQYYGVREAIRQGNTRAFIAECGTITNAADRALMSPDRVALALGEALGIPTEEDMAWTKAEATEAMLDAFRQWFYYRYEAPDGTPGRNLVDAEIQRTNSLVAIDESLRTVTEQLNVLVDRLGQVVDRMPRDPGSET